jgi:hypothetical protein
MGHVRIWGGSGGETPLSYPTNPDQSVGMGADRT